MEALRARYQKFLLAWLKTADEAGSAAMLAALSGLRETLRVVAEQLPEKRDIATAGERLFTAIAEGRLPPALEYRRLAGRIEQALRAKQGAGQDADKDKKDSETLEGLLAALRAEDETARTEASPARAELPASATPEKKDPLTATLEATADLFPLLGEKPKELRFTLQQRALWDTAVEALAIAWENERGTLAAAATNADADTPADTSADATATTTGQALRQAIVRLLEGALPLQYPAPLQLAEAMASAIDGLDMATPTPRFVTAFSACMELIQEKDFLEHEALDSRVAQLAERLERRNESIRSLAVDRIFAHEALEDIEQMRNAMEDLPPDTETITAAALHLREIAEPLDLPELAGAALDFAYLIAEIDPVCLDHAPGRDEAFAWFSGMEDWINQTGDERESERQHAELTERQARLKAISQEM